MLKKCVEVNIEIECLNKSFKDLLLNMLEKQCVYKSYPGRTQTGCISISQASFGIRIDTNHAERSQHLCRCGMELSQNP